jgi:hypothetical protein
MAASLFLRRRVSCLSSALSFGNSPVPQSLNDPKSLYQLPSGASGSDATHSCRSTRSLYLIARSSIRLSRCFRSSSGKLTKRILGNSFRPENGADQVVARLKLLGRVLFFQIATIISPKCQLRFALRLGAALCQKDKGRAERQAFLMCHAPSFFRKSLGNRNALPGRFPRLLGWGRHSSYSSRFVAPRWFRVVQLKRNTAITIYATLAASGASCTCRSSTGSDIWGKQRRKCCTR